MPTLGSLFDGSGGFPLAGSLCGISPAWASEVRPYPIAVTKERFISMKHLGDVRYVSGFNIQPVDVITFGSPCQNLSCAGDRAGVKHLSKGDIETSQSGLFLDAIRIIKEMRKATNGEYPKFAIFENVVGAFSSNGGNDFRTILEEFIKTVEPEAVMPQVPKGGWPHADNYVGDGWSIAYRVFNSQYIRTAQKRRRIYLVLDLTGQRAGKILFEREGLRADLAPCKETWEGFRPGIRESLVAMYGASELSNLFPCRDTSLIAVTSYSDAMPSYCVGNGQANQSFIREAVGTLNCMHDQQSVMVWKDGRYQIRRLMPTECARLQGFPDQWSCISKKDSLNDDEYLFWLTVRQKEAELKERPKKEYTREQMLRWYNSLHSDTAEYHMWGGGVALPCTLYVMQGVSEALFNT